MEKSVEGGARGMTVSTMRLRELLKLVQDLIHESEAAQARRAENHWIEERAREVLQACGRIAACD
jgi:hypothetical protein